MDFVKGDIPYLAPVTVRININIIIIIIITFEEKKI